MNEKQRALAAEVRAEMGRQKVTAAAIQRALDLSSSAWGTYFVQCTRDIPLSVINGVAEHLGMTGGELMGRADEAIARMPMEQRLAAMLSPAARAVVEEEQARLDRERAAGQGKNEDPPSASQGRRRSA
jgi:hypothetical protein